MSENKTLTAILAIISIFLLGAIAFGLTQIDGVNNKNSNSNATGQITNNNDPIITKSANDQNIAESNPQASQSITASKPAEEPKKELSATKETAKSEIKSGNIGNISEAANSNPEISIFLSAVKAAGLEDTLRGNGPLTVFAPNNEAFTKYLPVETLAELQKPESKDKLVSILKGHVITPKFLSSDLQNGQYLPTQQGGQLLVKVSGNQYYVDDIYVTKANIEATNGVIHVIDRIIPE
jgi:uncharacterized surface protein with fasciclin (FAS1) repeats